MKQNSTPEQRFDGWFIKAVEKLKELPEGDGAFASLMIVLPLYERYTVAKLKLEGKPTGENEVKNEIAKDLKLDATQRSIFWELFRNGFMRQAMGKAGRTKWAVSHTYEALPKFTEIDLPNPEDKSKTDKHKYVLLDPWKFGSSGLSVLSLKGCPR